MVDSSHPLKPHLFVACIIKVNRDAFQCYLGSACLKGTGQQSTCVFTLFFLGENFSCKLFHHYER